MKQYKMYQLDGADKCKARRWFDEFPMLWETNKKNNYKKSVAVKSVLPELLRKTMTEEDAKAFLHKSYEDIPFDSPIQRELQFEEAWRDIERYVHSEERKPIDAIPEDIELGYDVEVKVTPDFIFLDKDNKEVEVVKIKTSRPKISESKKYQSLELYSLVLYARTVFPDADFTRIGSIYYLRKETDSLHHMTHPRFDDDFFLDAKGKGTSNVVSLWDVPLRDKTVDEYLDPYVKKFSEGVEKEDCNEKDCEMCTVYDLCHFAKAPKILEKKGIRRSLHDLVLTDAQAEAVEFEEGICRINAGAGSGKTTVIAVRVVTLLQKGYDPSKIFLVTFTNSGAEEMRTRIGMYLEDAGLKGEEKKIRIQTFNAFGNEIIQKEYASLGFSTEPKIIDDVEKCRIIADLLIDHPVEGLDYKNFATDLPMCKGALTITKKIFEIVKAESLGLKDAEKIYGEKLGADSRFIQGGVGTVKDIIELYDEYDRVLRKENLIEFSDQENMVYEILMKDPYYLQNMGFEHILVDEFQDSTFRQIEFLKMFRDAPSFRSLMVVGDDSQSIYSFRYTSPEYILNFPKLMGMNVKDIYLMENFRSTPEICGFANRINDLNKMKIAKELKAVRPEGKTVSVKGFFSFDEERKYVVEGVKEHLSRGIKPESIAILCSTKHELAAMADELKKENIPSVMLNPEPLINNSRVRAVIALSNYMQDPTDSVSLLTYTNARLQGAIKELEMEQIVAEYEKSKEDIDALRELDSEEKKKAFMERISALDDNDEVYEYFVDTLSYKRINKIFEYCNDFMKYGSKTAVRRNHDYPGVVLTTAHSSKGMEWSVVYNMISKYHSSGTDEKFETVEERRRLLFVSSTRAIDELYITAQYHAYKNKDENRPNANLGYTYNSYLLESFTAIGKDVNLSEIEEENKRIRTEKEKERKAKKKNKDIKEGKWKKEPSTMIPVICERSSYSETMPL